VRIHPDAVARRIAAPIDSRTIVGNHHEMSVYLSILRVLVTLPR
jgi:hypothetical protein